MSFDPMSLKHGIPAYGSGYFPDEAESTTRDDQPTTGSGTSCSSGSSYLSHYSASTEPRPAYHGPSANMPAGSELLDAPAWTPVPHSLPSLPLLSPFAPHHPHGGDHGWDPMHQTVNPLVQQYSHHTLGIHASMVPQTVFRPGAAAHDLPLAPAAEKDAASSASKLFASSRDMLEAMVLSDEPNQASWNVLSPSGGPAAYGEPRCIDVSEPDVGSGGAWAEPAAGDSRTVSPKMLRIRQTPSPASSYESMHTGFLTGAGASAPYTLNNARPLATVEPVPSSHHAAKHANKGRKLLPDARSQRTRPRQQGDMSQLQPTGQASSSPGSPLPKLTDLRPMAKISPAPSMFPPPSPPSPSTSPLPPLTTSGHTPRAVPAGSKSKAKAKAKSKASAGGSGSSSADNNRNRNSNSSSNDNDKPELLPDRSSKDDFLVRQKQLGMTYKEIRRMGGFTEAESTLRGRYRTLTKSREARVRKPEWGEKDLRLLEQAVLALASYPHSSHSSHPHSSHPHPHPHSHADQLQQLRGAKVPWKKVAEYIVAHGGSYHFGNSTCRKRWDELVREREEARRGRGAARPRAFFGDGNVQQDGGAGAGAGVEGADAEGEAAVE
ncbi:uncharacterized protein THITE_155401 [Thermothielavioides terrestris NRRL 8126]|uniref:Myb-like domain-containing protein n=1 Tax=Thermothielavioides terrestris (strain ATCC 38088 / NRRL 8126) TaxID=578455 RepID=G2R9Q9_THETT|nr:uncharacterized protein THITE_155401 [Thermothielavioides terrestris NRRL 8126]AEO68747.1 hypothetical protein THITE_155401 [Thermothielavioides terrestris NRRL 8126]